MKRATSILFALATLATSACDTAEPGIETSERPVFSGKADGLDLVGSCETTIEVEIGNGVHLMTGTEGGNCWCDSSCILAGDCCDDAHLLEGVCHIGGSDVDPATWVPCPEGSVSAIQNNNYACVDPNTCATSCESDGSEPPIPGTVGPNCDAGHVLVIRNSTFVCVDPLDSCAVVPGTCVQGCDEDPQPDPPTPVCEGPLGPGNANSDNCPEGQTELLGFDEPFCVDSVTCELVPSEEPVEPPPLQCHGDQSLANVPLQDLPPLPTCGPGTRVVDLAGGWICVDAQTCQQVFNVFLPVVFN